jgi:hypothetical protein
VAANMSVHNAIKMARCHGACLEFAPGSTPTFNVLWQVEIQRPVGRSIKCH